MAARFQIPLSPAQAAAITRYFTLLLTWNARINLTGAGTLAELVAVHLPDSFALARLVPAGATLVDIGTGGGLPIVPFQILRADVQSTWVEPRAKRVAFLRTALQDGLHAAVIAGRVEDLRHTPGFSDRHFDVAVSRATFAPSEWRAIGASLVRPGGRVMTFLTETEASSEAESESERPGVVRLAYVANDRNRIAESIEIVP